MAAMMRHWACVVVLVGSACNREEPDPGQAPAGAPVPAEPSPVAPAEPPGGGLFLQRKPVPELPGHEGGLLGVTREVVEKARRSAARTHLVPDTARLLVRMEPVVLLGNAEAKAMLASIEATEPKLATFTAVLRTCRIPLETIDEVVFGMREDDQKVMVVRSRGIGTAATWDCLRTETAAQGDPLDLVTTGAAPDAGPHVRGPDELGYFLDDDTVVVVSKAWDAQVQERLRGEGSPALEGSLRAPFTRVTAEHPLWVLGLTTDTESSMAGTPMAGVDDVAVDVSLADGDLVLALSSDAGEKADAVRVRDELTRQLGEFRSILPMLGVPPSLGPKLEFVSEGDLVSLGLTITSDELRGLREAVDRFR